jgi:hypothetical protein
LIASSGIREKVGCFLQQSPIHIINMSFWNEEEQARLDKMRSEFLVYKEEASKRMEKIGKRIESFSPPRTSPGNQSLPITEEFNAGSVSTNFMHHIINVKASKDVTMQPDFSKGISSPDGRVVGGGVAGILVAASPVQFGVNSRVLPSNQLESKPKKLKNGSGRPRESLSLYQEGAENIKGVLKQKVKEKEEGMEQRLKEQCMIFTWFQKRGKKHRSLCLGFYRWIGVHNCAVRAPHCRMYQG